MFEVFIKGLGFEADKNSGACQYLSSLFVQTYMVSMANVNPRVITKVDKILFGDDSGIICDRQINIVVKT